jgi:DNA-binding NtrC family response regulator
MAAIYLDISDAALHLTLSIMLKVEGHQIVETKGDLTISDSFNGALHALKEGPVLMVVSLSQVPEAIMAMEEGVYGYALLPLQPGEIPLMVRRMVDTISLVSSPVTFRHEDEDLSLEKQEKAHILRVLRLCKGNQLQAAKRLGIGRNTLWRKLKRYTAEENRE